MFSLQAHERAATGPRALSTEESSSTIAIQLQGSPMNMPYVEVGVSELTCVNRDHPLKIPTRSRVHRSPGIFSTGAEQQHSLDHWTIFPSAFSPVATIFSAPAG